MTAITLIIILGVLIFVHELGHFLMAKKAGIRVDEFALGFPPKILSKKIGETEYCLNLIPLGGYVKIYGEDGEPDETNGEVVPKNKIFSNKPAWIKILVLGAGVLGNFIFAWFIFSLGFMNGLPSSNAGVFEDRIQNRRIIISEVLKDSPAYIAGLKEGDEIVAESFQNETENNSSAISIEKIKNDVANSKGEKKIKIAIKRETNKTTENLTLEILPKIEKGAPKPVLGIGMVEVGTLKLPFYLAPIAGMKASINMTKETFVGIFNLIKDGILGKADWSQVSGPVGIAGMIGNAQNFSSLLVLIALISINLAVINLIPIPALDGGRILFVLIESIIRRPIKPSISRAVNATGFVLLMILMLVVTFKDILKLIK
jgi:regulator of sigma E protease